MVTALDKNIKQNKPVDGLMSTKQRLVGNESSLESNDLVLATGSVIFNQGSASAVQGFRLKLHKFLFYFSN